MLRLDFFKNYRDKFNNLTVYVFSLLTIISFVYPDNSLALRKSVIAPQLYHTQESTFRGNSLIPVKVKIDNQDDMLGVRCYFRFDKTSPYFFIEMVNSADNLYIANLPVPRNDINVVEYLFLVVNKQKQVVLTKNYQLKREFKTLQNSLTKDLNNKEILTIKTEIARLDSFRELFSQSELIDIALVSHKERFGTLSGLYTRDQLAGSFVEGYFGAFKFSSESGLTPLKGLIALDDISDISPSRNKRSTSIAESAEVRSDLIDISGSNWKGEFWTSDDYEGTVVPITASITQDSNGVVTITTDLVDLGNYFVGDIYEDGHMMLYDQYDNEDWTTYFGPAAELSVIIADFVRAPTLEEPSPPLNIIELTRKTRSSVPIGAIDLLL